MGRLIHQGYPLNWTIKHIEDGEWDTVNPPIKNQQEADEYIEYLKEEQAKGRKWISGCPDAKPNGGCPGHDTEKESAASNKQTLDKFFNQF